MMIRRFGLTADETNLCLRVMDIEMHSKRGGRISLTNDPNTCLSFLGLDTEKYGHFRNERDIFEWLCGCRLFSFQWMTLSDDENANDRKRTRKRPMFDRWHMDFLPSLLGTPFEKFDTSETRSTILEEALDHFGKREEYQIRVFEHNRAQKRAETRKRVLNELLPFVQGKQLSKTLEALRHWTGIENGKLTIRNEPSSEEEEDVLKHDWEDGGEELAAWAVLHWKELERKRRSITSRNLIA